MCAPVNPMYSVTRLGFFKVLGSKFSFKCSQNVWRLFGQFRKPSLFKSNCIDLLFGQFLKKWATFNSNIGPTACDVPAIFSVRVSLSKLFLPVDTTWVIRPASFNLTFEIKKLNDLINAGNKFLQDGDQSTISFD